MKNFTELLELLKQEFSLEELAYNCDGYPKAKNNSKITSPELTYLKNILYELNDSSYEERIKKKFWEKQIEYNKLLLELLDIGEIKEIERYGGEGMGDIWYSIKYFPKHDIFIKINGWYASYTGTELNGWDDIREVKPKQVTVTRYEII